MVDIFPFPSIPGKTSEEQIAQIVDYLIQFKETLEFNLGNISTENLSPELIAKLNGLGADIQQSKEDITDEMAQKSFGTLTISDVVTSEQFKNAVIEQLALKVNFETGHLEYGVSEKEGNN